MWNRAPRGTYHLFAQVLPPRQLVRAEDGRGGGEGCSVIPDAEMHVRMTEARVERCRPEQRWRGTAAQRGPMQRYAARQLFDTKTIHGGNPDYRSARASGEGAVRRRTESWGEGQRGRRREQHGQPR